MASEDGNILQKLWEEKLDVSVLKDNFSEDMLSKLVCKCKY